MLISQPPKNTPPNKISERYHFSRPRLVCDLSMAVRVAMQPARMQHHVGVCGWLELGGRISLGTWAEMIRWLQFSSPFWLHVTSELFIDSGWIPTIAWSRIYSISLVHWLLSVSMSCNGSCLFVAYLHWNATFESFGYFWMANSNSLSYVTF